MSTNTPKGQVLKHSFLNSFLKSIKEIITHVSMNSLSLREKKEDGMKILTHILI